MVINFFDTANVFRGSVPNSQSQILMELTSTCQAEWKYPTIPWTHARFDKFIHVSGLLGPNFFTGAGTLSNLLNHKPKAAQDGRLESGATFSLLQLYFHTHLFICRSRNLHSVD